MTTELIVRLVFTFSPHHHQPLCFGCLWSRAVSFQHSRTMTFDFQHIAPRHWPGRLCASAQMNFENSHFKSLCCHQSCPTLPGILGKKSPCRIPVLVVLMDASRMTFKRQSIVVRFTSISRPFGATFTLCTAQHQLTQSPQDCVIHQPITSRNNFGSISYHIPTGPHLPLVTLRPDSTLHLCILQPKTIPIQHTICGTYLAVQSYPTPIGVD